MQPSAPSEYPPAGQKYLASGEGYPPAQPGGYPPAQPGGDYPPAQPGGDYPPAQPGGYPPAQPGGYPPAQPGGYPPAQPGGYPPAQPGGYPPVQPGGDYPPAQPGGYPPAQPGGYPPAQPGYPPAGDPGHAPVGPGYPPPGGQAPVAGGAGGSMEPFNPPPGFLDDIQGYDSKMFDDIPLMPPRVDDSARGTGPKDRAPLSGLKTISNDEAKTALVEYCNSNCCYGKTPAQEATINNMASVAVFHYTLETFTEQRSTAWAQVPFTGNESLDTAQNGPAPQPWDVPVPPPEKYKTNKKLLEVPHTASVKPCHKCQGNGSTACTGCSGAGKKQCTLCSGRGTVASGQGCTSCGQSGHQQCTSCSGSGRIKCVVCKGTRQLKWFIQLTVTWTNHLGDFIPKGSTTLPDKEIRKAQGQVAFQEEQPWLYPINHAPDVSINKASNDLIEKHRKEFPNERQLLQRQTLRVVPVTEVTCDWKNSPFTFFVFGLESSVYSDDYPQKFCCGCTIL